MDFSSVVLSCCCLLLSVGHGIVGGPVKKTYNLPKQVPVLNTTDEKHYRGDFIPNLPNPFRLNETSLSADSESVRGTLSLANTVATGLNKLVDDISINLITSKASATLRIPTKVTLSGDYNLDATINPAEDESTSVSGNGPFTATVNNLNLLMDAKLDVGLLSGKVSIASLDLQVSYDSISINAEGFSLNDETVDWDSVNSELNENFESVWSQYQEPLTTAITEGLNEVLSDATLPDLIEVFQGKKTFEELIKLPV